MRRIALIAWLALVAALAWGARAVQHRKVRLDGLSHWITTDPDSLHQLRRVERIFREGPPAAEFDAELSWPEGSAIPAPPYYPLVVWALLAPFAPSDVEQRRGWLEEWGCTLPAMFGALAAAVAAWCAFQACGWSAAVFVGATFAVAPGAIHYACVGNGDYQSWSTLLALAQTGVLAASIRRGALDQRRSACVWGATLGVLFGVAIGSWTPALIQLAVADAALGICIAVHVRCERWRSLPEFGLALHVAALVALAPAIWSSPWRESKPWSIVELSWFHVAYLLAATLVFVPLLIWRGDRAPRARRHYPWIAALAIAATAVACTVLEIGPGPALREAFSWAGASNKFMEQVAESAPLVGPGAWNKLALYLGYAAFAAPAIAAVFAWIAWRERRFDLAPWCLALLVFGTLAAAQMRFAELAVTPLALAVAVIALRVASRLRMPRTLAALAPIGALAAALVFHSIGVASTVRRAIDAPPFTDSLAKRSSREMAEWLRSHSPPRAAVMAPWGFGQMIQWAAERPVVASNYGHYTGEQAFLDGFRFFAETDPQRAEELLATRDVRFVLVTTDMDRQWRSIARALGLGDDPRRFQASLAARLVSGGTQLGFLRIVHASPLPDSRRASPGSSLSAPSGFVFERVAGARIEVRGNPGDLLEIELPLTDGLASFHFRASAHAGVDGVARVRCPYSTEQAGDFRPAGKLVTRFAGAESTLMVTEADVRSGTVLCRP